MKNEKYRLKVQLNLFYQADGFDLSQMTERFRKGEILENDGIAYAGIDIVLNCFHKEEILRQLNALASRDLIKVMIREQYFYPDYPLYQQDFEEKLDATFAFLCNNGYHSRFFEELL